MGQRHTRAWFFVPLMTFFALGAVLVPGPAMSGTIQYKYDDLGRVTEVTDPNNVKSIFTYDDAGNRTRHQITGSPNPQPPPQAVIVLPLNGFTIIPIE